LRDANDPTLRVFVVWEPVLITDWHAPGAGAVARIPDARVTQFWDPRRSLSQAIRRGRVVWDYVAIYPPECVGAMRSQRRGFRARRWCG